MGRDLAVQKEKERCINIKSAHTTQQIFQLTHKEISFIHPIFFFYLRQYIWKRSVDMYTRLQKSVAQSNTPC